MEVHVHEICKYEAVDHSPNVKYYLNVICQCDSIYTNSESKSNRIQQRPRQMLSPSNDS